jgi:hypothetical protein
LSLCAATRLRSGNRSRKRFVLCWLPWCADTARGRVAAVTNCENRQKNDETSSLARHSFDDSITVWSFN